MSELDQYTRWDKTHTKSIKVFYQYEPSTFIKEDRRALGVDVITCNPMVAEMFGVEVEKEDSILRSSILDAFKGVTTCSTLRSVNTPSIGVIFLTLAQKDLGIADSVES